MKEITSIVIIPAKIEYIQPLLAYCAALTEHVGFTPSEREKICLALEEIIVFLVQNLFSSSNNETIEITFEETPMGMNFIIHEKGLPVDPDSLPVYVPGSQDNIENIGIFLIRNMMDDFSFVNLGRKGKEWRMKKYLKNKRIDPIVDDDTIDLSRSTSEKAQKKQKSYRVIDLTPELALEVSKCAYRSYGYTYYDFIYYPDKIIELNDEGIFHSVVAVTEGGDLIGHSALKFIIKEDVIAELTDGFVDPSCRGLGIANKMADFCIRKAEELSLYGMFVIAVTSHPVSQKNVYNNYNFEATGILLAALPILDFKGLTGITTQRESGVIMFRPIRISHGKHVYLPDTHSEMIREIYRKLGLPIHNGNNGTIGFIPQGNTDQTLSCERDNIFNTAEIKVLQYDNQTLDEIKTQLRFCCNEHIDAIFCYLNLEDPQTPAFSDACEELGFFFAGILPGGLFGCDALILQYLNNVTIDYSLIQLHSPFSRTILSYIQKSNPFEPS